LNTTIRAFGRLEMSEDKGFEINDRRKASAGDAAAGDVPGSASGMETPGETPYEGMKETHDTGHGESDEFPAVDFVSFIGSLAASALMNMGEKFSPDQPDDMRNLEAARQMIDLLDLLKEKTRGNLTDDESKMMENLLYNLKMRFVQESAGK
jgi:uncharacterized protein DUF1844